MGLTQQATRPDLDRVPCGSACQPRHQAKPGTIDMLKRNEEILVYVARFLDNRAVALCPGVTGKPLAIGQKALSEKLRPLYGQYRASCGFNNRFCIFAAWAELGGRDGDGAHYLTEEDFPRGQHIT